MRLNQISEVSAYTTEPNWNNLSFINQSYTVISSNIRRYNHAGYIILAAFNGLELVGFLRMLDLCKGNEVQEQNVFVRSQYQNQGIASKLYDITINDLGYKLLSDDRHTEAGHRLWVSLYKSNRYNIYSLDLNTGETDQPILQNNKLVSILSPSWVLVAERK